MTNRINILILFICSAFTINSQVNLNYGLVGYFPLDGNANDMSSVGINGVGNNVLPDAGINGSPSTACFFNGVDANINCTADNRNISDTLSISVWVKTTTTQYQWIVGKYDWTIDRGYFIHLSNAQTVKLSGRNGSGVFISAESTSSINDGNWHLITGIITGNNWELWVDCIMEDNVVSGATSPDMTTGVPLTIGNYYLGDNGDHREFDGIIDEVRIYNRELNLNEIDVLCKNGVGVETLTKDEINVSVYPNPANDIVTIESNDFELEKVEVYNSFGSLVLSDENSNEINVVDLVSGVYFVKAYSGDSILTRKLIVE